MSDNALRAAWPLQMPLRLQQWRAHWASAWPALLGTLALVLAGLLSLTFVGPWQHQTDQADAARARALALRRQQAAVARPAPVAPADQQLLAALPAADDTNDRVATLLALAQTQGLVLQRSALGQAPTAANTALALQARPLSIQLTGPYPGLRQFVAQALQADPALLLDALHLDHNDPQASVLSAQLQWTMLMRASPTPAPAAGVRR